MRYLTEVADEGAPNYRVEDGVLVDETEAYRPYTRQGNEVTRRYSPSAVEREAEEQAWAARSGPVVTIRPGRKVA